MLQRSPATAQRFQEILSAEPLEPTGSPNLVLNMVQIPGGSFMMGSPEDEPEHAENESPQHPVTIAPFFMGQFPVTQLQWQFVASLPKILRDLDPDPSRFKGGDRPVERVSWHEATEFCQRLTQFTGKPYRLPTEAEWEYACRAGTTTPFHFGNIITPDVANYDGNYSYNDSPKGEYRKETTPVGHFKLANRFGLFDMHGNVWEWCQDHWHNSYEGAPDDGSAWIDSDAEEDASRVRRGGSWIFNPGSCRSASRFDYDAGIRDVNYSGFRVVGLSSRTRIP
ncbi:MAG: formylglycine-generating enzyme family protein [Oculatellaceae cyanobacterium Prado106]|nr:formylglycine-generating enzyme family protein [Oculatellaceae cyanobacterium Prado106]